MVTQNIHVVTVAVQAGPANLTRRAHETGRLCNVRVEKVNVSLFAMLHHCREMIIRSVVGCDDRNAIIAGAVNVVDLHFRF